MSRYNDALSEDEREQIPLEEYEDVVAYCCEGAFCGVRLGANKLNEVDLLFIHDEIGPERLDLPFSDGTKRFEIDENSSIVEFLSQIDGLRLERETLLTEITSWVTDIVLIDNLSKSASIVSDINLLSAALARLQETAEKASKS